METTGMGYIRIKGYIGVKVIIFCRGGCKHSARFSGIYNSSGTAFPRRPKR